MYNIDIFKYGKLNNIDNYINNTNIKYDYLMLNLYIDHNTIKGVVNNSNQQSNKINFIPYFTNFNSGSSQIVTNNIFGYEFNNQIILNKTFDHTNGLELYNKPDFSSHTFYILSYTKCYIKPLNYNINKINDSEHDFDSDAAIADINIKFIDNNYIIHIKFTNTGNKTFFKIGSILQVYKHNTNMQNEHLSQLITFLQFKLHTICFDFQSSNYNFNNFDSNTEQNNIYKNNNILNTNNTIKISEIIVKLFTSSISVSFLDDVLILSNREYLHIGKVIKFDLQTNLLNIRINQDNISENIIYQYIKNNNSSNNFDIYIYDDSQSTVPQNVQLISTNNYSSKLYNDFILLQNINNSQHDIMQNKLIYLILDNTADLTPLKYNQSIKQILYTKPDIEITVIGTIKDLYPYFDNNQIITHLNHFRIIGVQISESDIQNQKLFVKNKELFYLNQDSSQYTKITSKLNNIVKVIDIIKDDIYDIKILPPNNYKWSDQFTIDDIYFPYISLYNDTQNPLLNNQFIQIALTFKLINIINIGDKLLISNDIVEELNGYFYVYDKYYIPNYLRTTQSYQDYSNLLSSNYQSIFGYIYIKKPNLNFTINLLNDSLSTLNIYLTKFNINNASHYYNNFDNTPNIVSNFRIQNKTNHLTSLNLNSNVLSTFSSNTDSITGNLYNDESNLLSYTYINNPPNTYLSLIGVRDFNNNINNIVTYGYKTINGFDNLTQGNLNINVIFDQQVYKFIDSTLNDINTLINKQSLININKFQGIINTIGILKHHSLISQDNSYIQEFPTTYTINSNKWNPNTIYKNVSQQTTKTNTNINADTEDNILLNSQQGLGTDALFDIYTDTDGNISNITIVNGGKNYNATNDPNNYDIIYLKEPSTNDSSVAHIYVKSIKNNIAAINTNYDNLFVSTNELCNVQLREQSFSDSNAKENYTILNAPISSITDKLLTYDVSTDTRNEIGIGNISTSSLFNITKSVIRINDYSKFPHTNIFKAITKNDTALHEQPINGWNANVQDILADYISTDNRLQNKFILEIVEGIEKLHIGLKLIDNNNPPALLTNINNQFIIEILQILYKNDFNQTSSQSFENPRIVISTSQDLTQQGIITKYPTDETSTNYAHFSTLNTKIPVLFDNDTENIYFGNKNTSHIVLYTNFINKIDDFPTDLSSQQRTYEIDLTDLPHNINIQFSTSPNEVIDEHLIILNRNADKINLLITPQTPNPFYYITQISGITQQTLGYFQVETIDSEQLTIPQYSTIQKLPNFKTTDQIHDISTEINNSITNPEQMDIIRTDYTPTFNTFTQTKSINFIQDDNRQLYNIQLQRKLYNSYDLQLQDKYFNTTVYIPSGTAINNIGLQNLESNKIKFNYEKNKQFQIDIKPSHTATINQPFFDLKNINYTSNPYMKISITYKNVYHDNTLEQLITPNYYNKHRLINNFNPIYDYKSNNYQKPYNISITNQIITLSFNNNPFIYKSDFVHLKSDTYKTSINDYYTVLDDYKKIPFDLGQGTLQALTNILTLNNTDYIQNISINDTILGPDSIVYQINLINTDNTIKLKYTKKITQNITSNWVYIPTTSLNYIGFAEYYSDDSNIYIIKNTSINSNGNLNKPSHSNTNFDIIFKNDTLIDQFYNIYKVKEINLQNTNKLFTQPTIQIELIEQSHTQQTINNTDDLQLSKYIFYNKTIGVITKHTDNTYTSNDDSIILNTLSPNQSYYDSNFNYDNQTTGDYIIDNRSNVYKVQTIKQQTYDTTNKISMTLQLIINSGTTFQNQQLDFNQGLWYNITNYQLKIYNNNLTTNDLDSFTKSKQIYQNYYLTRAFFKFTNLIPIDGLLGKTISGPGFKDIKDSCIVTSNFDGTTLPQIIHLSNTSEYVTTNSKGINAYLYIKCTSTTIYSAFIISPGYNYHIPSITETFTINILGGSILYTMDATHITRTFNSAESKYDIYLQTVKNNTLSQVQVPLGSTYYIQSNKHYLINQFPSNDEIPINYKQIDYQSSNSQELKILYDDQSLYNPTLRLLLTNTNINRFILKLIFNHKLNVNLEKEHFEYSDNLDIILDDNNNIKTLDLGTTWIINISIIIQSQDVYYIKLKDNVVFYNNSGLKIYNAESKYIILDPTFLPTVQDTDDI